MKIKKVTIKNLCTESKNFMQNNYWKIYRVLKLLLDFHLFQHYGRGAF